MSSVTRDSRMALLMVIVVIAFSALAYGIHKTQVAIDAVHQVQCSQKEAFLDAADGTHQYLVKHPNGAPALGLTPAVLLRGAKRAEDQAAAFKISCPAHTVEHNLDAQ